MTTTDISMPQLALAFDTGYMRNVLAEHCLNEGYTAGNCRISHVRHKHGRYCLIRYELALRDQRGVDLGQTLCCRIYPVATSEARWEKALRDPVVPTATVRPVTHVGELGMIVWAFPNDRKLRGLDALLDTEQLAGVLGRILLEENILAARSEVVRYMPEQGCTFRITASLSGGRTAVLYAKSYVSDAGERTFSSMRQIEALQRRHLVVARPLAYLPHSRTLWTEALPQGAEGDYDPCIKALAELHAMPLLSLPKLPSPIIQLREAIATSPFESLRLQAIALEIERRLETLVPRESATLHGDLHRQNFRLYGDRAALLDLDTLHSGDPLRDLGSLLASTPEASGAIAAYPNPVDSRDLATYTALSIVSERITRSATRHKERDIDGLLDRAENLLTSTASARDVMRRFASVADTVPGETFDVNYRTFRSAKNRPYSHATVAYRCGDGIFVRQFGGEQLAFAFPHDPSMPWLAEATDAVRVRTHLPIQTPDLTVEIVNYRPRNRCTLRYRTSQSAIFGKIYCDDRWQSVHERLSALWALDAGDDFPMPEPLWSSATLHGVWQAEFPSVPLGSQVSRKAMEAAGARLRFLHQSGISCGVRPTAQEHWLDLRKKMAKLATVVPELEPRLMQLVEVLGETPFTSQSAVVHGDFHLRQLQNSDGRIALFDFDETGLGDPAEDFGHFIADLHLNRFDTDWAEQLKAGYGPALPPGNQIRWHTAVQLLTRAYRGLLQLRRDFDERTLRMVTLAEKEVSL